MGSRPAQDRFKKARGLVRQAGGSLRVRDQPSETLIRRNGKGMGEKANPSQPSQPQEMIHPMLCPSVTAGDYLLRPLT